MTKWRRRVRGAIGMGLSWALAWFGAGMVLLLIVGADAADVPFPLGFGMLGFFAGVTFSGVLAITEGRRTFDRMSLPRFAGWGALGGVVLSAVFVPIAGLGLDVFLGLGVVFGLAGAACAAGSLALARRAGDRASLDEGGAGSGTGLPGNDPADQSFQFHHFSSSGSCSSSVAK
jgi:hypothetical protein